MLTSIGEQLSEFFKTLHTVCILLPSWMLGANKLHHQLTSECYMSMDTLRKLYVKILFLEYQPKITRHSWCQDALLSLSCHVTREGAAKESQTWMMTSAPSIQSYVTVRVYNSLFFQTLSTKLCLLVVSQYCQKILNIKCQNTLECGFDVGWCLPMTAVNIITRILNWILNLLGGQCKDRLVHETFPGTWSEAWQQHFGLLVRGLGMSC